MSSINWKYIRNAIRGGSSNGHGQQTKKLVKFNCLVFELRKRTDRQTDRHTGYNNFTTLTGRR